MELTFVSRASLIKVRDDSVAGQEEQEGRELRGAQRMGADAWGMRRLPNYLQTANTSLVRPRARACCLPRANSFVSRLPPSRYYRDGSQCVTFFDGAFDAALTSSRRSRQLWNRRSASLSSLFSLLTDVLSSYSYWILQAFSRTQPASPHKIGRAHV